MLLLGVSYIRPPVPTPACTSEKHKPLATFTNTPKHCSLFSPRYLRHLLCLASLHEQFERVEPFLSRHLSPPPAADSATKKARQQRTFTMCQQKLYGPYSCGHVKATWEYCASARARSLLRKNPLQPLSKMDVTPSAKPLRVEWTADLTTACPMTCLAKPFRCCKCLQNGVDDKDNQQLQVGWICKRCGHIRCCIACTVMAGCGCAPRQGAMCRELVPQRVGEDAEGRPAQPYGLCARVGCQMWEMKDAKKHQGEGVWWKADQGGSQGK